MDRALRTPMVHGWEAQEELPNKKQTNKQTNGQRAGIIPNCYTNQGGEFFKREHMISQMDKWIKAQP